MNILMIRPAKSIGGAEIYNVNLIKGLKKYFSDVELFFITTSLEFKKELETNGAETFLLPIFSGELGTKRGLLKFIPQLPKYLVTYSKLISRINEKNKLDLICLQGATEKIFLTPILKIKGFRVIWLEHGPFFSFPSSKIIFFLYKIASHFADKIITVSKDARNVAVKNGINPDKIICIPTGIDSEYFYPLSSERQKEIKTKLGIKDNEFIIGYVGSICKEKGIKEFMEVAKNVASKVKNIKFLLVGEGEDLIWAKNSIKKDIKDKIIFAGFQKDVREYLSILDIFFFPTRHFEGIPLTLLEAMAMEKVVFVRGMGGVREIINDKSVGYLFKDETPEELVNIIVAFLNSPSKREKIGEEARERIVKYFNLKTWVTNLYNVFLLGHKCYEDIIARSIATKQSHF